MQSGEGAGVIKTERLSKRFGVKIVLRAVDFTASTGEFVALLGPNGAGKTTLLRILSSLSRASSGRVQVAGHWLPDEAAAVRRRLGVVTHQPLLYGDLTAEENLRFYARMYALSDVENKINAVLENVGLAKRRKDLVRTFSRGMQQRLAIGRAVLHDPDVLLLDEPHTGLDQQACEMLDSVLRRVTSEGRTVVMTSHDFTRAEALASRFDVLTEGRIVASTARADLAQDGLQAFYRTSLENAVRKAGKVPA